MDKVTKEDVKLVVKKLEVVKSAGWGKVEITVQNKVIVYISYQIGEQVKMELEPKS